MALPNPALSQIPDSYKYGWHDAEQPRTTFEKGISADVVAEISRIKGEPKWMTDARLKAYRHFEARPMPKWGAEAFESVGPLEFRISPSDDAHD